MKKITENPTIADTVQFSLEITDVNGLLCVPLKIDKIIISHLEKQYGPSSEVVRNHVSVETEKNYKLLRAEAGENPCQENILKFRDAQNKMQASAIEHCSYFAEMVPIYTLLSPNLKTDKIGVYDFSWTQKGLLQGDYVIQWTWTTSTKEVLTSQTYFSLAADKKILTLQPHHYVPEDKYEKLISLYTPQMYKYKIKINDMTPEVIGKLNKTIAAGFTFIEDLADKLADMLDPNLAHEQFLPLMANFFNVKLTSESPVRWRRQIARGIPLYKRKGTLLGLTEALDQAGIRLLKITKMWQIISNYTWTDGFVITNAHIPEGTIEVSIGSVIGELNHYPKGISEVKLKTKDSKDFVKIPNEHVNLINPLNPGDKHIVIWSGSLPLNNKDVITITYNLREIPPEKKTTEQYLLSLSLMDQSDPTDHLFPPKNWNTRLVEEDDPMFDSLVTERHPFTDAVVFGKIRTKFLYSEKVYNMDAYDGSLRNSYNPCEIDNKFIDSCNYCLSSKFNADVEIEDLSDSRIKEAIEIIQEYSPFHAQLHFLNVSGAINEILISPIETIESLITVVNQDKITPTVDDEVGGSEGINYIIEYIDGKKEYHDI